MIQQKRDRFAKLRDKRPWEIIQKDSFYWSGFHEWRNSMTSASGNVFRIIPVQIISRSA